MNFPAISLTYLAILALIYSALSLVVVAFRAKLDIPFGDGGNENLHRSIRAHGNFNEWVPLISILVIALEMHGEPSLHIHLLMGALLIARIIHPVAFASTINSPTYFVGRVLGALTSWLVLTISAVLLLVRL